METASAVAYEDAEQVQMLKRRRIRKGTTSCWQCKKRKTRCQYAAPTDEICVSCDRRGTVCLSQEFPENSTVGKKGRGTHQHVDQRLKRTENLIEQILSGVVPRNADRHHCEPSTNLSSPAFDSPVSTLTTGLSRQESLGIPLFESQFVCQNPISGLLDPFSTARSALDSRNAASDWVGGTSEELHAILPSQQDASTIIGAGHTPAFLQFFTVPYGDLFKRRMRSSAVLSAIPSPTSHPVLLIRTLLYLANGLQQLHPSSAEATKLTLGCSLQEAITQYITAATTALKQDEQFLQSTEGLECLILQGVYHINAGDLRPAWLCFRRCISVAQLMGFHCGDFDGVPVLDPESISSPALMWYRIVHQDRYLSLMLGVPAGVSGSYHDSNALLQGDCTTGRLECMHSAIMGRIVARNECRDLAVESTVTQEIDSALQKAARCLPSHWWLLPNARSTSKDKAAGQDQLEDIMRTLVQLTHFNLLILLHLPYMLDVGDGRNQQYSKTACANASRELLSRYTRFRSLYQTAFCCRSIDFAAFTASLTLILTHLESHCLDSDQMDFLAHQRLSDRAMIEESIDLMLESSCSGNDTVSKHTATILRRLLVIEAEAADRYDPSESSDCISDGRHDMHGSCVRLTIPYLGRIEIASDGITRLELSRRTSRMASPLPVTSEAGPNTPRGLPHQQISATYPSSRANSSTYQGPVAAEAPSEQPNARDDLTMRPTSVPWQMSEIISENGADISDQATWEFQTVDDALLSHLLSPNELMPATGDENAFDIATLF